MVAQTARRWGTCLLLSGSFWIAPGPRAARADDLATALVNGRAYGFFAAQGSAGPEPTARGDRIYLGPNSGGGRSGEGRGASINEESGLPIVGNKVLIYLKPDARPEDFGAIITRHKLKVPREGQRLHPSGILALQVSPTTPAILRMRRSRPEPSQLDWIHALLDAVDELMKERIVLAAAPDSWIGPAEISSQVLQSTFTDDNHKCPWQFGKHPPEMKNGCHSCGTYGLTMTRFPAVWNFNRYIERTGHGLTVRVGVLDIGRVRDGTGVMMHQDLNAVIVPTLSPVGDQDRWDKHTIHVSGIIGARWNNGLGIDGGCKYCRLEIGTISRQAQLDAEGRRTRRSWTT